MPKFGTSGGAAAAHYRSRGRVAQYVAGSAKTYPTPSGVTNITFPNAQAGDLGLIFVCFEGVAASTDYIAVPATWTEITRVKWTTFGYPMQVFKKTLSAGDIASGVNITVGPLQDGMVFSVAYRGGWGAITATPTGALSDQSLSTTLTVPGFSKSGLDALYVSFCIDRDNTSVLVRPTGFTSRISNFVNGFFVASLADITPPNYSNLANVVWSGGTGAQEIVGQVLKIT